MVYTHAKYIKYYMYLYIFCCVYVYFFKLSMYIMLYTYLIFVNIKKMYNKNVIYTSV